MKLPTELCFIYGHFNLIMDYCNWYAIV